MCVLKAGGRHTFYTACLFSAALFLSVTVLTFVEGCSAPQSTPAVAALISTSPTLPNSTTPPPFISSTLPSTHTPTLAPSSTPRISPSATSTRPRPLDNPRLLVLAQDLPAPDDLLLASDHSIYISDVADGTIKRLDPGGTLTTVLFGLQEPEGMAFLPDGSIVVAEQGKNRLVRFRPGAQPASGAGSSAPVPLPFLQLENKTGHPGVDGIFFDAGTQTIIVPDSPNGTLLRVSGDGKIIATIARGLIRPTGGDIEPDGSILVAEENGGKVSRVRPDGKLQLVARLPVPDDVIVDAEGNIYVNTLGDNAIHHIDALTGRDKILTREVLNPQGIIFDADGNLIVADPGHHRIVKLVIR